MNRLLPDGISPAEPSSIAETIPASGVVTVSFSHTQKLDFKYALPLPEKIYTPTEARIYLLEKSDALENSVYDVYLDNREKSAGYIFTVGILESRESDYALPPEKSGIESRRVQGVRNAALTAFCHLSKYISLEERWGGHDPISLAQAFGENTVVLLLTKDADRAPADFDLFQYLPSLFRYGYLYKPDPYKSFSETPSTMDGPPFEDSEAKSMRLRGISHEYPNLNFVKDVFCRTFPSYWSPITSFFLCYQFVEICIEEIRRVNGDQFIQDISDSILDNVKTENVIREYQRSSSEKHRVNKLFSDYLSSNNVTGILQESMALLSELGCKDEGTPASLYTLRNYFFHAFRLVQDKCRDRDRLRNISWEVFLVTLEVLICFRMKKNPPPASVA